MAFGTAPHRVNGVWVTREGRVLDPAGQTYWERHHQQGLVTADGHVPHPALVHPTAPGLPQPRVAAPGGPQDVPHQKAWFHSTPSDKTHHRVNVAMPDGSVRQVVMGFTGATSPETLQREARAEYERQQRMHRQAMKTALAKMMAHPSFGQGLQIARERPDLVQHSLTDRIASGVGNAVVQGTYAPFKAVGQDVAGLVGKAGERAATYNPNQQWGQGQRTREEQNRQWDLASGIVNSATGKLASEWVFNPAQRTFTRAVHGQAPHPMDVVSLAVLVPGLGGAIARGAEAVKVGISAASIGEGEIALASTAAGQDLSRAGAVKFLKNPRNRRAIIDTYQAHVVERVDDTGNVVTTFAPGGPDARLGRGLARHEKVIEAKLAQDPELQSLHQAALDTGAAPEHAAALVDLAREQKRALMRGMLRRGESLNDFKSRLSGIGIIPHDWAHDVPEINMLYQGEKPAVPKMPETLDFDTMARDILRQGHKMPPGMQTIPELSARLQNLYALVREGAPYRDWYDRAGKVLKDAAKRMGMSDEDFAKTVAATSPQAMPTENLRRALTIIHNDRGTLPAGAKAGEGMGANAAKARRVVAEGWTASKTDLKTHNYYRNLFEAMNPKAFKKSGLESGLTIDLHATNAIAPELEGAPKHFYEGIASAYRAISEQIGWTPKEVQAAAWVPQKARHDAARYGGASHEQYMGTGADAYESAQGQYRGPEATNQTLYQEGTSDQAKAAAVAKAAQEPDGGFTLHPDLTPDEGDTYIVARAGYERTMPATEVTPDAILAYRNSVLPFIKDDPNARIGGWHDPEDGKFYLDVSQSFADRNDAMAFGRENGQKAIFNRQTFASEPVEAGAHLPELDLLNDKPSVRGPQAAPEDVTAPFDILNNPGIRKPEVLFQHGGHEPPPERGLPFGALSEREQKLLQDITRLVPEAEWPGWVKNAVSQESNYALKDFAKDAPGNLTIPENWGGQSLDAFHASFGEDIKKGAAELRGNVERAGQRFQPGDVVRSNGGRTFKILHVGWDTKAGEVKYRILTPDGMSYDVRESGLLGLDEANKDLHFDNPDTLFSAHGELPHGHPAPETIKGFTRHDMDSSFIGLVQGKADITTLAHEWAHYMRKYGLLDQHEIAFAKEFGLPEMHDASGQFVGYQWDTAAEEKFARGLEAMLREGGGPKSIRSAVETLSPYFKQVYGEGDLQALSPAVRKLYDNLFESKKIGSVAGKVSGRDRGVSAPYGGAAGEGGHLFQGDIPEANAPEGPLPEQILRGMGPGARAQIRDQEAARTAERGRRFQEAQDAYDRVLQETGDQISAHEAYMEALKGPLPAETFTKFTQVTDTAMQGLFGTINRHSGLVGTQKMQLRNALIRMKKGYLPREFELKLIKKVFGEQAAKDAEHGNLSEAMNWIIGIANIPRSIMASFDVSAPFRQGLVAMFHDPRTFWRNFPVMFKYLTSEKNYRDLEDWIESRADYGDSVAHGVSYTDLGQPAKLREEQFQSAIAEHVPVIGHGIRSSGRAYTGFLNKMRYDLYHKLVEEAKRTGKWKGNQTGESIAEFVNWTTGRGKMPAKFLEEGAPLLNVLFFSPRLFASRLQTFNPFFYARLDPAVRYKAMAATMKMVLGGGLVLGLTGMLGAGVVLDPRSSDFGKIRLGNTRIDIWGGHQQIARVLAQLASGQQVSTTTGAVTNLRSGLKYQKNSMDVIGSFFRGKEAPPVSIVHDFIAQSNIVGDPFVWWKEAVSRLTPLAGQDAVSAAGGHITDLAKHPEYAAGAYLLGGTGFGVQSYGARPSKAFTPAKLAQRAKAAGLPAPSKEILEEQKWAGKLQAATNADTLYSERLKHALKVWEEKSGQPAPQLHPTTEGEAKEMYLQFRHALTPNYDGYVSQVSAATKQREAAKAVK